jgi:hypothetical protein
VLKRAVNRSTSGERLGSVLGTHTLRKTGYLFATWGVLKYMSAYNRLVSTPSTTRTSTNVTPKDLQIPCLSMANIMQSAWHKSVVNAVTYEVR